jgi:hypothetical protein
MAAEGRQTRLETGEGFVLLDVGGVGAEEVLELHDAAHVLELELDQKAPAWLRLGLGLGSGLRGWPGGTSLRVQPPVGRGRKRERARERERERERESGQRAAGGCGQLRSGAGEQSVQRAGKRQKAERVLLHAWFGRLGLGLGAGCGVPGLLGFSICTFCFLGAP